jgi:predicted DNA-binding mobile mystery protein A
MELYELKYRVSERPTTGQFAKRLGVKQPRTIALEKAEASGAITLESLARAAKALDCRLVYALVPRKPLEELVEERAALLAKKRLKAARHTMALEDQSVEAADEAAQLERLARDLMAQSASKLWNNE